MLMYVVKAIRGGGIEHFDRFLTDADRELLTQKILPISWYPFESYKRLFEALVAVVAGGDMGVVQQWGRDYGSTILDGVYRSTVVVGNPLRSLKNHEQKFASFYDFGTFEVTDAGPGTADVLLCDFDPEWETIYQMICGWLERTAELAGAREPRVVFTARSWAGDPHTAYKVTWQA
jgi:uncharacterized protein (TIGR02265 family)